ncbi:MAG: hypothetical protein LBI03_03130 [Clostridiales bacterium]|nr:hypothetical protein [Clostridiales bacterium]
MYRADFLPYIGTEKIKLGSTREEARSTLGTFNEFKKTKFSKNTTDDFSFCHVYYDVQNKVEAIEYFNSTEFLFKGNNLFSLNFSELKSFFGNNKIDFQEDDSGLRSDAIGLSVYSPNKEHIETILIYKRGYYD